MTTQNASKTPPDLNGRHQHIYEAILRHPVAHNLEWHDVRSLLGAVGDVVEGQNGALQVTRNGLTIALHAPKHKDITAVEDLLAIRQFLNQSGESVIPPATTSGIHLLVVIDHHEAKIYRTEIYGTVPQQLTAYDPHGFGRHLHAHNEETDGKRKPERKSFYEAIAKTLRGADQILLFGSGTGESSAMQQLLADLKQNHADVAEGVIGSIVIDGHHTTEHQLLALAREYFASTATSL